MLHRLANLASYQSPQNGASKVRLLLLLLLLLYWGRPCHYLQGTWAGQGISRPTPTLSAPRSRARRTEEEGKEKEKEKKIPLLPDGVAVASVAGWRCSAARGRIGQDGIRVA